MLLWGWKFLLTSAKLQNIAELQPPVSKLNPWTLGKFKLQRAHVMSF